MLVSVGLYDPKPKKERSLENSLVPGCQLKPRLYAEHTSAIASDVDLKRIVALVIKSANAF